MTHSGQNEGAPEQGAQDESPVQKRIDQLTKQKHQADRRATHAEEQNSQLVEQLVNLQGKIDDLSRRQTSSQPAQKGDPLAALLGTAKSPDYGGAPSVDLEGLIKGAVQEALGPVLREQAQVKEAQALFNQQQVAYRETAKEILPEALIDGSVEQQAFDSLWEKSPGLQVDPNGPALALAVVKGILGDRGSKQQEARKQAASPPNPLNPLSRIGDVPGRKASPEGVIQELASEGAEKGLDMNGLAAMIGLKMGRASLSEE